MDCSIFELNFNSVKTLPGFEVCAAFTFNSAPVFKEDVDIVLIIVDDSLSYISWGGDNQMSFGILDFVEKDETLAICQCFNTEVCYGADLRYDCCSPLNNSKNTRNRKAARILAQSYSGNRSKNSSRTLTNSPRPLDMQFARFMQANYLLNR